VLQNNRYTAVIEKIAVLVVNNIAVDVLTQKTAGPLTILWVLVG